VKIFLPDIALYGTGNLAWKLGEALHDAGYPINSVWGRNRSDRQALARRLNARALESINEGGHPAIKLVLVPDQAIGEVAQAIPADPASLVVHCAGAGEFDWLMPHTRCGIFWPLQAIRKELNVNWTQVPVLIDANRQDDLNLLLDMGQKLSLRVQSANAAERTTYHAAAVIAANFGNLLFDQAFTLLQQKGLDHRMLLPILENQLQQFATNQRPALRQTGPAARGDAATQQKHLHLLKDSPAHSAVYRLLSELIGQQKH
jgi:predicted short-subunit dehydrogenase-like oxidoreductase (DUF2520 family)